ncbi:putative phosphatase regulatory subunit-domain-containing protein [Russula earlei]|uniref:Phosphatase regulatory subunit-domain-containing protein n=1 Tax=Russula earlei TaxID=71964 RepID=A0ACC0UCL9_9AGAM|nr:putative phosphatase regulatory subunit-domain-containing protein [Russula earlei]
MTSTLLATHNYPSPRNIHYLGNSSTAPLPLTPRRLASANSTRNVHPLIEPPSPHSGVIFTRASPPTTPDSSNSASAPVHVLPPTPPSATQARPSSTVSFPLASPASPSEWANQPLPPRRFRTRRFPAIRPPEQSTPTPANGGFIDDTPSASRIGAAVILSRNLSDSHVDALAAAAVGRADPSSLLLRKKSGEPLKSSLKAKRAPARGSLTVITDPVGLSSSKSAPATPAHKGVRFHSQLEQVKLFLAEQKPLAVSRDGSPTDTSGTDSEFPSFIYAGDDDFKERPLIMHRIDMPTTRPLVEDARDVAVENVDLTGTTIEGVVRVRNIAFEKWIAVRFTLDNWQTTSEVTARYKESFLDGTIDRFVFSIKLADVLARAEEKTLFLAVRYSVAGREIWDNNNGRNYQVRVGHEKPLKPNKEAVVEKSRGSLRPNDIADLRRQLEQVVKLGRPSGTIGGLLAQHSRRRWGSPSPTPSPPPRDATPTFKSEGSLAARYDFAASLRTPWRAPSAPMTPSHSRTNTYPTTRPNSVPWPQSARASCGSPRDTAEASSYFPDRDSDHDRESEDGITIVPSLRRINSGSGPRNHTRGGAIELSDAPSVKRTPPTSPFGSPALPSVPLPTPTPTSSHSQIPPYARFSSFPPHSAPKPRLQAPGWVPGVSEDSTPSITSSSSSRSPSPSPSLSPAEPVSPTRLVHPGLDMDEKGDSPNLFLDYHNFVSRFCFYTGSGPDPAHGHPDFIPRAHSASSIEEFLSAGHSPPLGGSPYHPSSPFATPRAHGRGPAAASDDELQRSGSATPTGPTIRRFPPTTPTPLLF